MKQGKHSLGHLLIEGNTVCSKTMLLSAIPAAYPVTPLFISTKHSLGD
jgi:hypothetical protein